MISLGRTTSATITTPNVVLTSKAKFKPEDKHKMRADFEALQSGANQHRVAVLDQDMDIKQLSLNAEDASWMKGKNNSLVSKLQACSMSARNF